MLLSFGTQNILEELLQVLGLHLGQFCEGLMEDDAKADWGAEGTPQVYKKSWLGKMPRTSHYTDERLTSRTFSSHRGPLYHKRVGHILTFCRNPV